MSGKHNSATERVDGQPTRAHRSIIPLVNDITAHETRMRNEKLKETSKITKLTSRIRKSRDALRNYLERLLLPT